MSEPINRDWTQIVAERKIQEAIEAGEFDDVPGMGEPVDLTADPFTPVHVRLAHKVLSNAKALPAWLQLEKDIQQGIAAAPGARERGLKAIRAAKNAPSRERAAARLRAEQRDRMDVVNTMILKYCFAAPAAAQQPFAPFNIKREMAALDEAIAAEMAAGAARDSTGARPAARRRPW